MKEEGYVAIPQDKETGYVLRTWQEEQNAQISILAGPEYEEVNRANINLDQIKAQYRSMVMEIKDIQQDEISEGIVAIYQNN